jgi:hypothetical protein
LAELKAKAAALSFSSHQNGLNDAKHFVEDVNRRTAPQNLDAADRCRKAEGSAYLAFLLRREGGENFQKYHLVFRSIPTAIWSRKVAVGAVESPSLTDFEGNESEVLLGISDLVEGPKGVIPSFICPECFKEITVFRWQILAASGQIVSPFFFGWAEGEFDGLERGTLAAAAAA